MSPLEAFVQWLDKTFRDMFGAHDTRSLHDHDEYLRRHDEYAAEQEARVERIMSRVRRFDQDQENDKGGH